MILPPLLALLALTVTTTTAEMDTTTWELAFDTITDHVRTCAPLLLMSDIPNDDTNGYVGNLLNRYGFDNQSGSVGVVVVLCVYSL